MGLKLENICVVLDSGNSQELSDFYTKLLGWQKYGQRPQDEWIALVNTEVPGAPALLFQEIDNYVRPVWPGVAGQQLQMMHLDFHVEDVQEAVAYALSCGATLSEAQTDESFRVMLDPAGHPFCICPRISA